MRTPEENAEAPLRAAARQRPLPFAHVHHLAEVFNSMSSSTILPPVSSLQSCRNHLQNPLRIQPWRMACSDRVTLPTWAARQKFVRVLRTLGFSAFGDARESFSLTSCWQLVISVKHDETLKARGGSASAVLSIIVFILAGMVFKCSWVRWDQHLDALSCMLPRILLLRIALGCVRQHPTLFFHEK